MLAGSHPQLATEYELIIIAQYSDFSLGNHFASMCLSLQKNKGAKLISLVVMKSTHNYKKKKNSRKT